VNKFAEETRIRQVDEGLAVWRKANLPRRPPQGWIKTIRMALGMTSGVLAQRVGDVSDSAIRKLELAEAEDAITLASLRRVAEALDCELQYALIPRLALKTDVVRTGQYCCREADGACFTHDGIRGSKSKRFCHDGSKKVIGGVVVGWV
jgi:predicted DNA-binding mobile mystery protein A